jgi:hypothetical protein
VDFKHSKECIFQNIKPIMGVGKWGEIVLLPMIHGFLQAFQVNARIVQ